MDAVRCPECGDVRWSFFGFGPRTLPLKCELCGSEMVPERRRPSSSMRAGAAAVERRHEAFVPPRGPTGPAAA